MKEYVKRRLKGKFKDGDTISIDCTITLSDSITIPSIATEIAWAREHPEFIVYPITSDVSWEPASIEGIWGEEPKQPKPTCIGPELHQWPDMTGCSACGRMNATTYVFKNIIYTECDKCGHIMRETPGYYRAWEWKDDMEKVSRWWYQAQLHCEYKMGDD